jgi:hypothetical protein
MKYNTLNLQDKLPDVPCLLDIEALYANLATLSDVRKAKQPIEKLSCFCIYAKILTG